MIFKFTKETGDLHPKLKQKAEAFSFENLNKLIYENHKPILNNIQKKIDDRIYPDMIASIYRKMYENGLVRRGHLVDALLACSYFLQTNGYKFLGFIRKDEETFKESSDLDFISQWDFEKDRYNIIGDNPDHSKEDLAAIFSPDDFVKNYDVFFIAGSQSFELLDLRVKRAANLIAALITEDFISLKNCEIILSGWNNSKIANSKVQFANESLAMSNLIVHKLLHRLALDFSDEFINEKIQSEINSKDTNENIDELIKKLEVTIATISGTDIKQLNLFIISSSFHLLQLSAALKNKEKKLREKLKNAEIALNLFLVGSENPNHRFKIYESIYIKLLMNEVIHRNFKFCRKKSHGNN